MADVFISYCHADKQQAAEIASYLETHGYTVSWDKSSPPGDDFRVEIRQELTRASAVIVLWSKQSIYSNFLRAEAGVAQREMTLIPTKLPSVSYFEIPPPFNMLHTVDLTNKQEIRAAVQVKITKPVRDLPFVRKLRREVLVWFGVCCSAITVFSAMDTMIKMARWAHWVSQYWLHWMSGIWSWLASLLGVQFSKSLTGPLTLCIFLFSSTLGARLLYSQEKRGKRQLTIAFVRSYLLAFIFLFSITTFVSTSGINIHKFAVFGAPITSIILFLFMPFIFSFSFAINERKTTDALIVSIFVSVFIYILIHLVLSKGERLYGELSDGALFAILFGVFLPLPLLYLITTVGAFARRLVSVAIVLAAILALNELSKLGLDIATSRAGTDSSEQGRGAWALPRIPVVQAVEQA